MREHVRRAAAQLTDIVLRIPGALTVVRALDLGGDGILRVLTYHRVVDSNRDPLQGHPGIISATPDAFAEQIRLLARYYAPISITDLQASLNGARALPRRAVLVTFDDGYRDFLTHAWPVLKEHGVPVVLFVPTAFPDRGRLFWWDEVFQMLSRSAVPAITVAGLGRVDLRAPGSRRRVLSQLVKEIQPLHLDQVEKRMAELRAALGVSSDSASSVLTWEELRVLAREGVVIASHGRNHASMPSLTETEIAQEIDGAQADLERELGSTWGVFAYPFGHCDPRTAEILEDRGFFAAFGTVPGRNIVPVRNRFAILRQSVNAAHSIRRVQLGLSGLSSLQPLGRLASTLRSGTS